MDYLHTIRHFLATLAMRMQHAARNAPDQFDSFQSGHGLRTPRELVEHIIGMMIGTRLYYLGEEIEAPTENPWAGLSWNDLILEFHKELEQLDNAIESGEPPSVEATLCMFQGPLCDAMTHVGQLIMMRRLAESPVERSPYYKLDLKVGHVGPDQPLE